MSNEKRRSARKAARSGPTFYLEVPKLDDEVDSTTSEFSIDNVTNPYDYDSVYMFDGKTGGVGAVKPNFEELRANCLQNKTLFNDESFTPETIALSNLSGNVQWKRPKEISKNPQFIVDGTSRFDIDQGNLGDCWFLAALTSLTTNEKLFNFMVPTDQSFSESYAGIFHFRFWLCGKWVEVVIDDRLPTVGGKLAYLASPQPNEFWPPLLEKAYAKFYGSYKNIDGGLISEALEDMSGGLSESYVVKERKGIIDIMQMCYERSSFMGCSIESAEIEGERKDGLLTMHAYSLTAMQSLPVDNDEIRLLRLRNPWGGGWEWTGDWSDKSHCWNLVPADVRNSLRSDNEDGEFWIQDKDFLATFTNVDICHLHPGALFPSDGDDPRWNVTMIDGVWIPNVTAGGGFQQKSTFPKNPQYFISIQGDGSRDSFAVVIGLMQKQRRQRGEENLPLELNVFRLRNPKKGLLDDSFFESNKPVLRRQQYGGRQLTIRTMLPVGVYCIVPSTTLPNKYASYLLRIYSESGANVMENDDEIGYSIDPETQATKPEVHDDSIMKVFKNVAGKDQEVGWYKVQTALNQQFGSRPVFCFIKPKIWFSKGTCKNIVGLFDPNYSGTLDCNEFWKLLETIAAIKMIFDKFDVDRSGKLDGFELRNLLTDCGYKVNKQILVIIMTRYGHNGYINFENFVVCSLKLKSLIEECKKRETSAVRDEIHLNRKEWLQKTMYS